MATTGDLIVKIAGNVAPFQKAIGKARKLVGGFAGFATNSLMKFGFVANGAKAIGGMLSGLSMPLELAANAEKTHVAFEVMTGSAEKAKKLLDDIDKFAASTPFESTELQDAGKKLLAFGEPIKSTVATLKQLGDISAGVNVPIGDLAEIYGKARVAGRLMAEDVNQLTGRGIPVIQEFAKQFGVGTSEVKKLVSEGKIGFPQLQKAITDLTSDGGKFAGMTEKQSKTIGGIWSTLVDNSKKGLRLVGQTIINSFDLKGMVERGIGWVQKLVAGFQTLVDSPMFKTFFATFQSGFAVIQGYVSVLGTKLLSIFESILPTAQSFVSALIGGYLKLYGVIQKVIGFLMDGILFLLPTVKSLVGFLIDGFTWTLDIATKWIDVILDGVAWLTPIFKALFAYVKGGFLLLWDAVKFVWDNIKMAASATIDFISDMFPSLGASAGDAFSSIRDFMVNAFIAGEFAMKNWKSALLLGWKIVLHGAVKMGNQIEFFFTKTFPAAVRYFAENWKDIFGSLLRNYLRFIKNIDENFKRLWKSIKDLVKGKGWNFDAVSIRKGMEEVFKKPFDAPVRIEGDLEKRLRKDRDQLAKSYGDDLAAFTEKRRKELFGGNSAPEKVTPKKEKPTSEKLVPKKSPLTPSAGIKPTSTKNTGPITAAQRGSKAALDAIFNARKTTSPEVKEQQKTNTVLASAVGLLGNIESNTHGESANVVGDF